MLVLVSNPLQQPSSASTSPSPATPPPRHIKDSDAEEAFTSFYLRKVTTELAEDLDKLRSAQDFIEKSIPMLVDALKQGRSCFTKDERVSIGRSAVESEV